MNDGTKVALAGVATVATIAAVSVGAWGLKIATSDVKGRGDVVIKRNDADNRIFQQGHFRDLYEQIVAADQNITTYYLVAREDPKDKTARDNLTGTIAGCRNLVAAYNADARKVLGQKYLDGDLPTSIGLADPATDCKEDAA